jgi:protein TonB
VSVIEPPKQGLIDPVPIEPDIRHSLQERVDPGPLTPLQFGEDEGAITQPETIVRGPPSAGGDESRLQPIIIAPAIPSAGLSEPIYPASEIRAGHTGTALLLLEILPNGRVGEVRLEQSSGFSKLDQSAMREARKWRFVPGTRDGVPFKLWKQVPIKFELHDRP